MSNENYGNERLDNNIPEVKPEAKMPKVKPAKKEQSPKGNSSSNPEKR